MKKELNAAGEPRKSRRFGNKNAAKPEELHRIAFRLSVAPETLPGLDALAAARKMSRGRVVDALVADALAAIMRAERPDRD